MQNHFKTRMLMILGLLTALGIVAVLAQGAPPAVGPAVNPASVQKKAGTPVPANATKAKSDGGTAVKVSTANSAADDDSFWTEEVDIDGDGDVDATSLVWDDEDKVLYSYSDGAFTCANGGTGTGELLIAAFAAGWSPSIRICYDTLEPHILEMRRKSDSPKYWYGFEWLRHQSPTLDVAKDS